MADGTRRTTFNNLLTLTREYLVRGLNLPDERVFRAIRPVVPKNIGFQADLYLVLRPGGARVEGEWADSEGRLATAVSRELIVEPYIRLAQDTVSSNDKLAQVLLGYEDDIVNLLQIFEPTDSLEPFHWLGVAAEETQQTASPGWAWDSMRFSVKFLQLVDQRLQ